MNADVFQFGNVILVNNYAIFNKEFITSKNKKLLFYTEQWYKRQGPYNSSTNKYVLIEDDSEFLELAIKELNSPELSGPTLISSASVSTFLVQP